MTVKSAPFYWVECDGCGACCDYGDEYAAFGDVDQAVDVAVEYEWTASEGRHHCPECRPALPNDDEESGDGIGPQEAEASS